MACFFQIAMGPASELEYYFMLAHDLGFISDSDYSGLNQELLEVIKMLKILLLKS